MLKDSKESSPVGLVIRDIVIREKRKRNLNINKFAKLLGIPRSSVYNLEEGKPPTINSLDNIIQKLGLSWSEVGHEIENGRSNYVSNDDRPNEAHNNGSNVDSRASNS